MLKLDKDVANRFIQHHLSQRTTFVDEVNVSENNNDAVEEKLDLIEGLPTKYIKSYF